MPSTMFGTRRTHHTTATKTHHRSRWGRPSRDRQAAGYKVHPMTLLLVNSNVLSEMLDRRR